jgi:predicted nucleic acid-binding protein
MAQRKLMAHAFYDTNIFLYAAMRGLPTCDQYKRPIAQELIGSDDYAISGQVLAEFYGNIVKKGPAPFSHDEALEWIKLMAEKPCVSVDSGIVIEGGLLAKSYKITYWDGAIVAAAHATGASKLYTEDLNDGQVYGTVKAINPFKNIQH